MKRCKSITELKQQFDELNGGWSRDTIFIAKAMMFMCEQAAGTKPNRPRSAWQKFFGKQAKLGKSAKEIAAMWNALKSRGRGSNERRT